MRLILWSAFVITVAAILAVCLVKRFPGHETASAMIVFVIFLVGTVIGMRWDPPGKHNHRHH